MTKLTFPATITALIVLFGVVANSTVTNAQENRALVTGATTVQPPANNPRSNFVTALETFTKQIDGVHKDIAGAIGVLDSTQKQTPEMKREELTGFRNRLLSLEQALGPDAPFPQAVERFDAWVSSQITRLNNQRGNFGSQQVVEDLLAKYRAFQGQVGTARELIAAHKKEILQTLQELVATENLAAEWLLVGEAEIALNAMNGAIDGLKALIEGIKTKVHEFNLTAARS